MFPIEIYCIILSYCSELDIINFSKTSKLGQEVLNKIREQVILKNLNSIIDPIIIIEEEKKKINEIIDNIISNNIISNNTRRMIYEINFRNNSFPLIEFINKKSDSNKKEIVKNNYNLDEIKKYKSLILKNYIQNLYDSKMFLSLEILGHKFIIQSRKMELNSVKLLNNQKLNNEKLNNKSINNNNLIKFSILTATSLFLARKLYQYLN